jgi:hypothetical protein
MTRPTPADLLARASRATLALNPGLGAPAVSQPVRGETPVESPAKGLREAVLQQAAEQWLALHGIEYLHLSPRAREKQGWPDLVFAVNGRAVAIELKKPSGVVSEAQRDCLDRLAANGWRVAVARSIEEVRRVVEEVREG